MIHSFTLVNYYYDLHSPTHQDVVQNVFFAFIYILGEWVALSVFIYISFGQAHLGFVKVILFLHIQFYIQMSWDVPRNCFHILLK